MLVAAVAVLAAWCPLTLVLDPVNAPVAPVVATILSVPIAVLGQRRPLRAAALLLVAAVLPIVLVLVRAAQERSGVGSVLGGSSGAVGAPLAFVAILFLVAGALRPRPTRSAAAGGLRAGGGY